MVRDRIRSERRVACFYEWRQDLRYGARQVLQKPTFAAIVIGTLAIGIGANTVVFSVLEKVLLEPLPYKEPDRLTYVWHGSTGGTCCGPLSGPDFLDLRETSKTFESIAGLVSRNTNLTGEGDPEMVLGGWITPGFLGLLGVQPARGRAFSQDDALGKRRVVILSDGLWRHRLGADPNAVGRTMSLNRESYTVVGVMPPGFNVPSPWRVNQMHDVYVPLSLEELEEDRGSHWLLAIGRLRAGTSLDAGDAELKSISRRLEEQYPQTNFEKTTYVHSMHERLVGRVGEQLIMLLGAAGFVLMIVCGNVASLMLARATGRRSEMAIRAALGAGRGRIVRQLLTESLLLSLLGGAAGVLLSLWGVKVLRTLIPSDIPRIEQIGVDVTVLGFALVISILTGIVFGLAPARSAARMDIAESLKEGKGLPRSGSGRSLARGALVVSQFALALVLANGAALMVQSYLRFRGMGQGFDPENVLTVAVALQGEHYQETAQRDEFLRQAVQHIEAIPGVREVGATSKLPLMGGTNNQVWVEDDPERPPAGGAGPLVEFTRVSADYFPAIGIRLVAGRYLAPGDASSELPGAIINQEMARRLWPEQNPIGKRFSFRSEPPQWITVVGVVENVRQWGPYRPAIPENYLPFAALPWKMPRFRMYLVIRADVDPLSLVDPVRHAVWAVDRYQPISEVSTMKQILSSQFARQKFNTILMGLFSAIAIVLVTAGVYGVVSYFVAQSTHEIGIRMALGAGRARVLCSTIGRGLELVSIGVLLGVAGVFASTQLIRSMLYGASPTDLRTIIAGVLFLVIVGVLALLIPAQRAARVDPLLALRNE